MAEAQLVSVHTCQNLLQLCYTLAVPGSTGLCSAGNPHWQPHPAAPPSQSQPGQHQVAPSSPAAALWHCVTEHSWALSSEPAQSLPKPPAACNQSQV